MIVKDAIQLYGKVEVDGIATIENLMIRARQCLDMVDMDEAVPLSMRRMILPQPIKKSLRKEKT